MTGTVIATSDPDFVSQVQQAAESRVLVYFWAPWCGPCRLMSPVMNTVASLYADRLTVLKMEVDTSPDTVARYNVQGVPALVLLKQGEVVSSVEGAIGKQRLLDWLNVHLAA